LIIFVMYKVLKKLPLKFQVKQLFQKVYEDRFNMGSYQRYARPALGLREKRVPEPNVVVISSIVVE
jgi:hypothetical protein